jgi:N-acetylmuramoyl-L-alanine amidase
MRIVISSGHGLHVRGAKGPEPWGLDEVDEARAIVPEVAKRLRERGHQVVEFHDDTSQTQDQNLKTIVNFHNNQTRDLDVSVHLNAYTPTTGGRGTEVLYVNHDIEDVAARVSAAIAEAGGLINRGAHHRSDLYFLNKTSEPAILLEICFVDAQDDVDAYEQNFAAICDAIAEVAEPVVADAPVVLRAHGKVSWFGGPHDEGVDPDEGLAFLYEVEDKPGLFLPEQPPDTTGLARRLDGERADYIAMRWDYDVFSKEFLRGDVYANVRAPRTGREFFAAPADWGPHSSTGRVADISPGLMKRLGIETDDEVEVEFPASPSEALHAA